ncbi:hypothetical protein H696_04501 [Fonticula alba]|uniref:Uncharacterized protein n=1 Tax=Fonticula alba TaxID=691883 RepID=A0A058Z4N8_FONAL|nr:hypothetical protein H696_04501 [Fonticula alba]KCV69086.1 hypothetical protein H696_04501 [Fonticula alba]|eukprot:XP_009496657.1 hypothetical protein H696_04501 [Fonticula alba]
MSVSPSPASAAAAGKGPLPAGSKSISFTRFAPCPDDANIDVLTISGLTLDQDQVEAVVGHLRSSSPDRSVTISFHSCQIRGTKAHAFFTRLVEEIREHRIHTLNIHTLELERNTFDPLGFRFFASNISHIAPALVTLSLHFNRLTDSCLSQLSRYVFAAARATVQHLFLSQNEIGDYGVQVLAASLGPHLPLRSLSLAGNEITDKGCVALAAACRSLGQLQLLDLSTNSIEEQGIAALAMLLDASPSLSCLRLAGNDCRNRSALQGLVDAATKHRARVTELDISNTGLDGEVQIPEGTGNILSKGSKLQAAEPGPTSEPATPGPGPMFSELSIMRGAGAPGPGMSAAAAVATPPLGPLPSERFLRRRTKSQAGARSMSREFLRRLTNDGTLEPPPGPPATPAALATVTGPAGSAASHPAAAPSPVLPGLKSATEPLGDRISVGMPLFSTGLLSSSASGAAPESLLVIGGGGGGSFSGVKNGIISLDVSEAEAVANGARSHVKAGFRTSTGSQVVQCMAVSDECQLVACGLDAMLQLYAYSPSGMKSIGMALANQEVHQKNTSGYLVSLWLCNNTTSPDYQGHDPALHLLVRLSLPEADGSETAAPLEIDHLAFAAVPTASGAGPNDPDSPLGRTAEELVLVAVTRHLQLFWHVRSFFPEGTDPEARASCLAPVESVQISSLIFRMAIPALKPGQSTSSRMWMRTCSLIPGPYPDTVDVLTAFNRADRKFSELTLSRLSLRRQVSARTISVAGPSPEIRGLDPDGHPTQQPALAPVLHQEDVVMSMAPVTSCAIRSKLISAASVPRLLAVESLAGGGIRREYYAGLGLSDGSVSLARLVVDAPAWQASFVERGWVVGQASIELVASKLGLHDLPISSVAMRPRVVGLGKSAPPGAAGAAEAATAATAASLTLERFDVALFTVSPDSTLRLTELSVPGYRADRRRAALLRAALYTLVGLLVLGLVVALVLLVAADPEGVGALVAAARSALGLSAGTDIAGPVSPVPTPALAQLPGFDAGHLHAEL